MDNIKDNQLGRLKARAEGDWWKFYLELDDHETLYLAKVHLSLVDKPMTRRMFSMVIDGLLCHSVKDTTGHDVSLIDNNKPQH